MTVTVLETRPAFPPALARALRATRRRAVAALLCVVITVLLVWPAVMTVVSAFRGNSPGEPGVWTLAAFSSTFSHPATLQAIASSCWLAVFTTVVGLALASAFAFLAARTDAPFARLITPAMLLMFATPSLFYAIGYDLLANPFTGTLNVVLEQILGPGVIQFNVETWSGLLIVTSFRAVAFMYLFLIGPFHSLSSTMDEASLISGFGKFQTFLRIDLPVLAPALTGTAILGLMAGLQTFDTALIIGDPVQIKVISIQIYDYIIHSSPPRYGNASVLSTLLILVVGALCVVQARILGRRSFATVGGKGQREMRLSLGSWRPVAGAFIAIYLVIAEFLPLASLVLAALQPFPGVMKGLSLTHFVSTLERPGVLEAIGTTLLLMLTVGAAAMTLATVIATQSQRLGRKGYALLRFVLLIPYAMAGIVVALAVTAAYVSVPGLRMLYGTFWLMMIAMIVVTMPFATQAAQAAIAQVGRDVQEAARTSGASVPRMVREVLVPMIAPSFLSGWYVTAVIVAGNLDVPLILGSPGLTTVSARVYGLMSDAKIGDAVALLVMLMSGMAAIGVVGLAGAALVRRAWQLHQTRISNAFRVQIVGRHLSSI